MRLLPLAALAALASCFLRVDARLLFSPSRTKEAFAELRGAAEPSAASETEGNASDKAESASEGAENSSDKEQPDEVASSAETQASDQASNQEQPQQANATAGAGAPAAAADEAASASAAEPKGSEVESAREDEAGSQRAPPGTTGEQQQAGAPVGGSATESEKKEGGSAAESAAASAGESQLSSGEAPAGGPAASAGEQQTGEGGSVAETQSAASAAESQVAPEAPTAAEGAALVPAAAQSRIQPVAPHTVAEERPQAPPGPATVQEITAHCVLTHNKIRTARLDQWPDPLAADDVLADAARKHAKDYIAHNCRLSESTKLDPMSELIAPKEGDGCDGLGYVFLDGLSAIQQVVKDEFPGPFSPSDTKSPWSAESARKLALIVSETAKQVGCAATAGCPNDVIFCKYSPALVAGSEIFSKHLYAALKKRERIEGGERQFLPKMVADHEIKTAAGAKVTEFESQARPISWTATIVAGLVGYCSISTLV